MPKLFLFKLCRHRWSRDTLLLHEMLKVHIMTLEIFDNRTFGLHLDSRIIRVSYITLLMMILCLGVGLSRKQTLRLHRQD